MERLSRELIAQGAVSQGTVIGPSELFPVKVVQVGEGNFLRAFTCWMVNELNMKTCFAGSMAVVQPREGGKIAELASQDCLYTLITRGLASGELVDRKEIITSISKAVDPYRSWNEFLSLAAADSVRFFVSNTTEAGIVYTEEQKPSDIAPASFPAKVCAFLYERFNAFHGDPSKGIVFLPCELIDRNGSVLKEVVLRHAADWNLPAAFIVWLEESNLFVNTLVDRIVPGYPKDEASALEQSLGYHDHYLDVTECYHVWVLEGDGSLEKEIPFAEAGLNVVWTDDLPSYRTRKVKVLNGLHTMTVLASFLAGHETVRESVEDPLVGEFMRRGAFLEILPTIDMNEKEKISFAEEVFERFRNPFMKHYCLSIALNSVSKFKVRVLPSILDYYKEYDALPKYLCFSLAALSVFYRISGSVDGIPCGSVNGKNYPVRDDDAVTAFFSKKWTRFSSDGDLSKFVSDLLSCSSFWGSDLSSVKGLAEYLEKWIGLILATGMKAAISRLLREEAA